MPSRWSFAKKPLSRMNSLPGDVLLDIAEFLAETRADLLHFSLSSSFIYYNIMALLYKRVALDSAAQCMHTLDMLARCPNVASHVQALILRPGNGEIGLGGTRFTVAEMTSRLARSLSALHTFIWDAEEMPPYDYMWLALRSSCPLLKSIGTSIGSDLPQYNSHLYNFSDLVEFSLAFKPGFLEDPAELFDDPASRFNRLWEMLLNRCPRLCTLCIDGVAPEITGAQVLFNGRWPDLRSLTIGDVALDSAHPPGSGSIINFLAMHSNIKSLTVSRHVLPPMHLRTMQDDDLPILSDFCGSIDQLQALPNYGQIRNVCFREAMLVRDVTPHSLSSVLQHLPNLSTLRLAFVLQSPYESGTLLRYLVASCPKLVSFDLTCGNKPSFSLESFVKSIQQLSKLRSFTLSVVKYPGDPSLASCGEQIARANPRLKSFELILIPAQGGDIPLPTPLTAHPDAYIERARFKLTANEHGLPIQLVATHRYSEASHPHLRALVALRLSFTRLSYHLDLRPGHRAYNGAKAWLGMLLENNVAGEEMRMMTALAILGTLALLGFLTAMSHPPQE